MRGLRLTVFVLAFFSLTTELIRHSYVRWVENHISVLDKYEVVDKEIKEATSLAALEKRYAEELDKQKAAQELEKQKAPREGQFGAQFNQQSAAVNKLNQAIAEWERRENEIRELRYFWSGGFVCLLLALICHWRGLQWVSIALQIAGFAEMTWWTSPSIGFGVSSSVEEVTRLLDNKIAFTVLAFALLLMFWFTGVLRPQDERSGAQEAI